MDLSSNINHSVIKKDMSSLNIANVQGMNISGKEKLMKTAQEFEAVFISRLLNTMNSTVEKSELFGDSKVQDKFRSMMNQHVAKDIASNPQTSFGMAKQIYEQMKDLV